MPMPGPLELVIILVIALLILGPGKLPEVGSSLGKSIREFRKASSDVQEAVTLDVKTTPVAAAAAPAPAAAPAAPAAPVTPGAVSDLPPAAVVEPSAPSAAADPGVTPAPGSSDSTTVAR